MHTGCRDITGISLASRVRRVKPSYLILSYPRRVHGSAPGLLSRQEPVPHLLSWRARSLLCRLCSDCAAFLRAVPSTTPRSHWLLDEPLSCLVVRERLGRPTHFCSQGPATALAVTAEGASCVAHAVPSGIGLQASVVLRCMLAAPRVPTDRFKGGVRGAGRASPAPRSWKRRAARSRRVVRRSNELIMCLETVTFIDFKTPPARGQPRAATRDDAVTACVRERG